VEKGFTSPTQREGSRHAMQRKSGSAASEHRTASSLRSLENNFMVAGVLAMCCSAWCTHRCAIHRGCSSMVERVAKEEFVGMRVLCVSCECLL
jgi:hypothetical protein